MTSPTLGTQYANQAAEVAAKLKHGSYDAVQALAFVSIAQSLAQIADALEKRDTREQK
jgi:hypothetical protein